MNLMNSSQPGISGVLDFVSGLRRHVGTLVRGAILLCVLYAANARANTTVFWDDASPDETGFKVERSDAGGPFVQIAVVAANVTTYVDTTTTGGVVYSYRVRATSALGDSAYSNVISNAPTFSQIASQTVTEGNNGVFAALVIGDPAPTLFQWQRSTDGGATWVDLTNTSPYSGVTTTTLTVTAASVALNSNQFRLVATNPLGSRASNAAVLTVNALPVFTSQPSGQAVLAGGNATFTIVAASSLPVTYQWQRSTDGGATWTNLINFSPYSGVTTTTLTVTNATTGLNDNQFRCIATSSAGSTASNPATLNVNVAPVFTSNPQVYVVTEGTTLVYNVTVTGFPVPAIQWQVSTNGGSTWSDLTNTSPYSGVTTLAMTISNAPKGLNLNVYRAVATNSVGTAISAARTLNIYFAPSFVIQPVDGTAGAGAFKILPTTAFANPTSISYQWQTSTDGVTWTNLLNGSPYSGVNSDTLTISPFPAGSPSIKYRNLATNFVDTTLSNVATFVVSYAPIVTTSPANQTITAGNNTSFSVVTNANPAANYQWQVSTNGGSTWSNLSNTSPYSGVTTSTLAVTAAPVTLNNNQYRAVATNSNGSANSAAAVLTVQAPPTFTTQPSNQFTPAGGNTSFTAVASGNPAVTYQWQISTTAGGNTFANLANDSTYAGVTSGTLSITAAGPGLNNFNYRVVGTNSVASTNSAAAVLTIGTVAPSITTNPSNISVSAGSNATFSAAASGGPAPTLQWQVSTDGGATFGNISNGVQYSGVTTGTLTVTAAPFSLNNARYQAVATNVAGSATTTAAVLTVNPIAPTITLHPTNQGATIGSNASFTVAATGVPAPSLQWQVSTDGGATFNNLAESAPYSGTTTTTLTITNATAPLDGYKYRAVATNAGGSANSNAGTLSIGAVAPAITTNPSNQTVPFGGNASFTVAASGGPAPTFQWQVSTNGGSTWSNVSDGGVYSGATTTTLAITGVTVPLNTNRYRAVATNVAGNAASAGGILTITFTAPTITSQPTNQNPTTGGNATFTVAASGSPTPTIQWQKDGVALSDGGVVSGSTTTTLSLTGVTPANAGTYTAVATNAGGTATSNGATLIVNAPPAFTVHPSNLSIPAQQPTVFSVVVTGTPTPTLQWLKNLAPIAGATSATFVIGSTSPGDAGSYTVLATNSLGTVSSNAGVLTVTAPLPARPTITSQPTSQTKKAGESASFSVSVTGSTPLSYQWRKDGVAISNATGSSLTLSNLVLTDAATYTVTVTNAGGSVTSAGATLAVAPLSYEGEYFGTFANNGGSWALFVRPDGTGLLIAFLSATKTSIVENVTVSANGTFNISVVLSDPGSGQIAARESTPPVAAAATTLSVAIVNGAVSGQLGNGLSMSGAIDAATGSGSTYAGLYTVSAIGTSQGTTYTVIGKSGQALAVIVGGTSSDAATGQVNSSGQLAGSTATGSQFNLGVNGGALTTTVTAPGGTPVVSMGISDSTTPATRLANMSARAIAGTGEQTFIIGFIAQGGTKPVLLRAVGPGLTNFGFTNPAADPQLSLYSGSTVTQTNDNWGGTTALKNTFTQVGAFGLADSSKDAALTTTLSPQAYTIVVGASGTTLAEIYDADVGSSSRLINLSARAQVGTGDGVLIIGFIVPGNAPKKVLLRAVGPSLARFGILALLADPQIELYQGSTLLSKNDDWGGGTALTAAFDQAGAFALNGGNSKDAALIVTLAPGVYTAVVSGVNGTTGVGLAEIYELH